MICDALHQFVYKVSRKYLMKNNPLYELLPEPIGNMMIRAYLIKESSLLKRISVAFNNIWTEFYVKNEKHIPDEVIDRIVKYYTKIDV